MANSAQFNLSVVGRTASVGLNGRVQVENVKLEMQRWQGSICRHSVCDGWHTSLRSNGFKLSTNTMGYLNAVARQRRASLRSCPLDARPTRLQLQPYYNDFSFGPTTIRSLQKVSAFIAFAFFSIGKRLINSLHRSITNRCEWTMDNPNVIARDSVEVSNADSIPTYFDFFFCWARQKK